VDPADELGLVVGLAQVDLDVVGPDAARPAPRSASVLDPYTSGSRVPRRPRLGPFSTRIVVMRPA
jgi:hypothetical protein